MLIPVALVFRQVPFGTVISNRAPLPGMPVSRMLIPVMARISFTRKRPSPVFFPNPRSKIRDLSPAGIPTPSSSITRVSAESSVR